MSKFISKIVQPQDVGKELTKMVEEAETILYDWKAIPYWASDQKHDVILLIVEFRD